MGGMRKACDRSARTTCDRSASCDRSANPCDRSAKEIWGGRDPCDRSAIICDRSAMIIGGCPASLRSLFLVLVSCPVPRAVGLCIVDTGDLHGHGVIAYKKGLQRCHEVDVSLVAPSNGCQRVQCMLHPCRANLFHLDVDSEVIRGDVLVFGWFGSSIFLEADPTFLPFHVEAISSVMNDFSSHDLVVDGMRSADDDLLS